MGEELLDLKVVTPERALVHEKVDEVQVPGLEGYLGLLPGHAPLFSQLTIGELSYRQGGVEHSIVIAEGFVEVFEDEVRVLADVAEPSAEVDLGRATEARRRADQLVSGGAEDVDYPRALSALKRADVRLRVGGPGQ